MTDTTEAARRELIASGELEADAIEAILAGEHWNTDELQRDFRVLGFMAPFVVVERKADGVKGSLEFTHRPRIYFAFKED